VSRHFSCLNCLSCPFFACRSWPIPTTSQIRTGRRRYGRLSTLSRPEDVNSARPPPRSFFASGGLPLPVPFTGFVRTNQKLYHPTSPPFFRSFLNFPLRPPLDLKEECLTKLPSYTPFVWLPSPFSLFTLPIVASSQGMKFRAELSVGPCFFLTPRTSSSKDFCRGFFSRTYSVPAFSCPSFHWVQEKGLREIFFFPISSTLVTMVCERLDFHAPGSPDRTDFAADAVLI